MKAILLTKKLLLLPAVAVFAIGCTGQLPGSFRLAQQEEVFSSQLQINTKIDLLWVVDNSSSMDPSQEKLRAGFEAFANKYMQPTWDIRVAVITTDAYLANPAFTTYLSTMIPQSNDPLKLTSAHMKNRPTSAELVSALPGFDPATGAFANGLKYGDLVPIWGPDYAKLLPNIHDGPIPGLCFEGLPYFLFARSKCDRRDVLTANLGIDHCLNPNTGAGETSMTQCVNTRENNTVHSGKPIISTKPATPFASDAEKAAWAAQLVRDFRVNITTGSVGNGSERGLSSVLQMIEDNEKAANPADQKLFREGSLRGIIFVSDEDDQSVEIPATPPAGFTPWTNYACDKAGLLSLNNIDEVATPANKVSGNGGYCCSNGTCRYGAEGTTCPSKTVDGYTYTPSICPLTDKLIPVSTVKESLDSFFRGLDGAASDAPANYFVASIIANTSTAIQQIQLLRDADDAAVFAPVNLVKSKAVDFGERYKALGDLVGNGSVALNIGESDYSLVLDAIGKSIIENKSVFTLVRAPTGSEEMIVRVIHGDGTVEIIPATEFTISGKSLIFNSLERVLGFTATDQISINYQPKTLY